MLDEAERKRIRDHRSPDSYVLWEQLIEALDTIDYLQSDAVKAERYACTEMTDMVHVKKEFVEHMMNSIESLRKHVRDLERAK